MKLEEERLNTTMTYLNKLSLGTDPFTGEEISEDSLLNNVYLSRSFRYAADIMEAILKNRCCITPYTSRKKREFHITEEEKKSIPISSDPIGISVLANRVAAAICPDVKGLPGVQMTSWLEDMGLLKTVTGNGEKMKVATEDGNAVGIVTAELLTRDGRKYKKNLYEETAQRFIIENLEIIGEYSRRTGTALPA